MIKIQKRNDWNTKIGIDEIVGLKEAMIQVMKPVLNILNEMESFNGDGWFKMNETEYKRRDGFIPYSHNYGGIEIGAVIPKCGECDFGFLEFGECEECVGTENQCGDGHCLSEDEGHLDAYLRVLFKFEGYNETTGTLSFYLNVSGGNNDAPYFRVSHLPDLFEAEFECKSIKGIKRAASAHIKKLIKALE